MLATRVPDGRVRDAAGNVIGPSRQQVERSARKRQLLAELAELEQLRILAEARVQRQLDASRTSVISRAKLARIVGAGSRPPMTRSEAERYRQACDRLGW